MLAKDVMNKKVLTLDWCMTVAEAARFLDEKGVSGVPVTDAEGSILGVVSKSDISRASAERPAGSPRWRLDPEEDAEDGVAVRVEELGDEKVERIMTPGAIALDEETPVADLARAMLDRHIHRVLITRRGKLAGIVTTMDLLKFIASPKGGEIRARRVARR